MQIDLTLSQYNFIYSKARHPAFVGSWSTGKTLAAISRAIIYSKGIPYNLGVIFIKTARYLHDSTLKDFETYTKLKVNSDRNLNYPNGSMIMFRHLDEIASINQQNINLGWFYIEQGDELDSNREFFMLFGRLRRDVKPSEEFIKLGLVPRSGWVIANAGDHWMLPLWKEGKLEDSITDEIKQELGGGKFSELTESATLDEENKKFVKSDFIASLKILESMQPELFMQYVKNDWTVSVRNKIYPTALINLLISREGMLAPHSDRAGVAVDPAGEGIDDNIFMAGRGGEPIDVFAKCVMAPSEKAIKAVEMCRQIHGYFIIIDCDGIGQDTYRELLNLDERYTQDIDIIAFHGSAPSEIRVNDRLSYRNKRTEASFIAQKRGWAGKASINGKDTMLVDDLKADEYELKNGILCLIPKVDIKERLGRSPGRGDCWKMLQWAFEQDFSVNTFRTDGRDELRPAYAVNDDTAAIKLARGKQGYSINTM